MKTVVATASDVIWRRIGDEVVVLKDNGLEVDVLNKTAAHVWEMCKGDCGLDEIVASLCEHFEVTPDEARTDAAALIDELEQIGIVKQAEEVTQS